MDAIGKELSTYQLLQTLIILHILYRTNFIGRTLNVRMFTLLWVQSQHFIGLSHPMALYCENVNTHPAFRRKWNILHFHYILSKQKKMSTNFCLDKYSRREMWLKIGKICQMLTIRMIQISNNVFRRACKSIDNLESSFQLMLPFEDSIQSFRNPLHVLNVQ